MEWRSASLLGDLTEEVKILSNLTLFSSIMLSSSRSQKICQENKTSMLLKALKTSTHSSSVAAAKRSVVMSSIFSLRSS